VPGVRLVAVLGLDLRFYVLTFPASSHNSILTQTEPEVVIVREDFEFSIKRDSPGPGPWAVRQNGLSPRQSVISFPVDTGHARIGSSE
jgi:hypothetical protein